jgi:SAM-dependent methyltransferase
MWAGFDGINTLQLRRLVAILSEISRTGIERPSMLELGCGTGWLTGILGLYGAATGIDFSNTAIEYAQAHFSTADFRQMNVEAIDSLDRTFDVIVSHEVIEHLDDQPGHVRFIWNHLRAGGFLVMTTPNGRVMNRLPPAERKKLSDQPRENYLNRRGLKRLLKRQGFRRILSSSVVPDPGGNWPLRTLDHPFVRYRIWRIGLDSLIDSIVGKFGFGLHLVVSAMKPPLTNARAGENPEDHA